MTIIDNGVERLPEEPEEMKIPYGPEMFLQTKTLWSRFPYSIAVDKEGHEVCTLRDQVTQYFHGYCYEGGADMEFLDRYQCLLLHDANEYSVELLLGPMRLWKGKRLILAGENWEKLIPMLPDLPGIECFYEANITDDRLHELAADFDTLMVTVGLPHQEPMDRYEQHLMYYDEIMAFTFFFSDFRRLGDANPDKYFYVIECRTYANLGLFAFFTKATTLARYAKAKGYIPVIHVRGENASFYQDFPDDDVWAKFYQQPEEVEIEEVLRSQNVTFAPFAYNGAIQDTLMNRFRPEVTLSWRHGTYNDRVMDYIKERQPRFLPHPDRTLGVLIRGTDYVSTTLHNHAIHATKEMVADKIDEVLETWGNLEEIYLATEDADYCDYFKARYGEKLHFTDQRRYRITPGEMLSDVHREETKRDGFLLGVEYILSIYLLAQCRSFLASGGCGGVGEALKENDGRYEHTFIFDLGINR